MFENTVPPMIGIQGEWIVLELEVDEGSTTLIRMNAEAARATARRLCQQADIIDPPKAPTPQGDTPLP